MTALQDEIKKSLQLAELTRYAVVDVDNDTVRLHVPGEQALARGLEELGLTPATVTTVAELEAVIARSREAAERDLLNVVVPRSQQR